MQNASFTASIGTPKEEVQEAETNELIDKIYDGSIDKLFAALLGRKKFSAEQNSHYARAVCCNTLSRTAASGYCIICFYVVYCMVCRNNTYHRLINIFYIVNMILIKKQNFKFFCPPSFSYSRAINISPLLL